MDSIEQESPTVFAIPDSTNPSSCVCQEEFSNRVMDIDLEGTFIEQFSNCSSSMVGDDVSCTLDSHVSHKMSPTPDVDLEGTFIVKMFNDYFIFDFKADFIQKAQKESKNHVSYHMSLCPVVELRGTFITKMFTYYNSMLDHMSDSIEKADSDTIHMFQKVFHLHKVAEKRCKKPNHVSHRAPWRPVNRVKKHSGAQSADKS